ncbi:MAG: cytochrome c [Hyphomicrobiaceae bacterium]
MRFKSILTAIVLLAVAGAAAFWFLTQPNGMSPDVLTPHTADLANGKTMFNIGGCASCHATPVKDAKPEDRLKLGGGLALNTPFGTFKVPNISPDENAGIGRWTELQFVNAMQRGIGPNGEHLYPAFPYTSYQRMRLEDVRDLFAYLKTLPPVSTASQPHDLAFPFNIRRGLGLWKLVFLDGKPFQPSPSRSAELNRGAYLIEGPGHCAECHSPRNVAGAIIEEQRFAGGPDPEGKGWVPNITSAPSGLGKWSAKDIAYLLEMGETPGGDYVGGSMADVIPNTAALSAEDRNAMAAFLKSLPAREGPPRPSKTGT